MGQQQIPGGFPIYPGSAPNFGINLIDSQAVNQSSWTTGASVITQIALPQPLSERWMILGWSITFGGQLTAPTPLVHPFGKLGNLVGGLVRGSPPTAMSSTPEAPWSNPFTALPPDSSLLDILWNGADDPVFPWANPQSNAPLPRITHTYPLPQPISFYAGDTLSMGMWLMPSLSQGVTIRAGNANYVLSIDDGEEPRIGWGGQ